MVAILCIRGLGSSPCTAATLKCSATRSYMKQQKLRQRRLFAALLFGLSVALFVSACSSTPPEQPTVTLPPGGSTPGTEAPPATEAPTTTEAPKPDRLIVFASARAEGVDLESGESSGLTQGYFEVRSPYLTQSGGNRWTAQFDDGGDPGAFGFLSLRYKDAAVVAFMDAHVGLLNDDELRDMRHWARDADAEDLCPGEPGC